MNNYADSINKPVKEGLNNLMNYPDKDYYIKLFNIAKELSNNIEYYSR